MTIQTDFNYTNPLTVVPTRANFSSLPGVYCQGRWFEAQTAQGIAVTTITQGAALFFQFQGSTLALDFIVRQTPCVVAVAIDQRPYVQLPASEHCVVATGLDQGHHTAKVVANGIKENDDLWFGGRGLSVKAIRADAVRAVKPVNPVGWFLGDSITAGIHVNGHNEPLTNSFVQSYGSVASQLLKVNNVPTAFGATGITTGGSGDVPQASAYLNFAKDGVAAHLPQPDFCVVNYGTNDRDNRSAFKPAFARYLQQVATQIPNVPIIVLQPFIGGFVDEIEAAVKRVPTAQFVRTDRWPFEGSDQFHPSASGSLKLGQCLAEALVERLGKPFFSSK